MNLVTVPKNRTLAANWILFTTPPAPQPPTQAKNVYHWLNWGAVVAKVKKKLLWTSTNSSNPS